MAAICHQMNTNPQRHVVSAARMLQAASKELSSLIETLSPSTNGASHRNAKRTAHKVIKQAPAKAASTATKIAPSAAKKAAWDARHLTEEEKEAAKLMLTRTSLPVTAIARALDITRAAVYGLRDRLSLEVRKRPTKQHRQAPKEEVTHEHQGALPA